VSAPLRIAFLGTADFAVPALTALAHAEHTIAGVFTRPDRPAGRGRKLRPPPVKAAAAALGLPVHQSPRVSLGEGLAQLRDLAPDLIVVIAYGEILRDEALSLPRRGAVNLHASLLPKYRGAAPIQWALLNGETTTGVTAQWMARELDAGDIILQRSLAIGPEENFGSLHDRLARLAAEMAVETVALIARGEAPRTAQEAAAATFAPPITREDLLLDWRAPGAAVVARVRAFSPSPGARTTHEGRSVKVLAARLVKRERRPRGVAGAVVETGREGFMVAAGEDGVLVLRVQPEGRKPMSGADYALGYHVRTGQVLGGSGQAG
jgi:methionyl-tRNA formyltransferase